MNTITIKHPSHVSFLQTTEKAKAAPQPVCSILHSVTGVGTKIAYLRLQLHLLKVLMDGEQRNHRVLAQLIPHVAHPREQAARILASSHPLDSDPVFCSLIM